MNESQANDQPSLQSIDRGRTDDEAWLARANSWRFWVQAFFLCRAFSLTEHRFNVIEGAPNDLYLSELPIQTNLALIARFVVEGWEWPDPIPLRIAVTAPESESPLPPFEMTVLPEVAPPDEWDGRYTISLPIDLSPYVITEPGTHTFTLYAAHREVSKTVIQFYSDPADGPMATPSSKSP